MAKLSFSPLFSEAWVQALTPRIITSGFHILGMYLNHCPAIKLPCKQIASLTQKTGIAVVQCAKFQPYFHKPKIFWRGPYIKTLKNVMKLVPILTIHNIWRCTIPILLFCQTVPFQAPPCQILPYQILPCQTPTSQHLSSIGRFLSFSHFAAFSAFFMCIHKFRKPSRKRLWEERTKSKESSEEWKQQRRPKRDCPEWNVSSSIIFSQNELATFALNMELVILPVAVTRARYEHEL